jgi:dTDP-glucose 4,6-dehydratase
LDHVNAIDTLIEKGKSGQVYNITAWNEIANRTIVEKILHIMNKPQDLVEYVNDRPGHDKRYSINASKIMKETGWKPAYQFDYAIQETVSWYQNNRDWWEPLADEKTLHPQPWTINW